MPQLDTFTYLSQITWTFAFFTVFFAITATHVLPAISRSINVRLKKLASGGDLETVLSEEKVSAFSSFESLLSNSFASSRDLITKTSGLGSDWVKSNTEQVNKVDLQASNKSYVQGVGYRTATKETLKSL